MLHRQVELGQNVLALPHHPDELVGQILGMACHEADALDADGVQLPQQLGEADVALQALAIAVDILAQEHDLLHAAGLQLAGFLEDRLHLPGALTTADIGDDAVTAEVVAAIHDGDVGCIAAKTLDGQLLGDGILILHHDHGTICVQGLVEQLGQLVQVRGTKGQVNKLVLFEDPLRHAGLLDHAAAHGNDELGVLLAYFLQPGYIAQRPALRIIADAAGIENDKVRLRPVSSLRHAHITEHTGELF